MVSSRKLYAIVGTMKKRKGKCKFDIDDSSDSEIEECSKKLKLIQNFFSKVNTVTNTFSMPLGISVIIQETFKCCICKRAPIKPPLIYGCCCKRIIGCHSCVEGWYKEKKMNCPRCQGDRGMANMAKILGLSDFLSRLDGMDKPTVSEH